MSSDSGFDLKWFFCVFSMVIGFFMAQYLANKATNFYYVLSQVLFAFLFAGICGAIYDRIEQSNK